MGAIKRSLAGAQAYWEMSSVGASWPRPCPQKKAAGEIRPIEAPYAFLPPFF